MADKKRADVVAGETTKEPPKKVSDEELRVAFSGTAHHSNKIYATGLPFGLRLSFMEQLGDTVPPVFRTAVILSYPDAIELRDLLGRQLKDIEGWHCHVNRKRPQRTVSIPFQVAALALSHTLNASVRNRLNADLPSK